MKKQFLFIFMLFISLCALQAQQNRYSSLNFTNPPLRPGESIQSNAYSLSHINISGEGYSYISAHTTFNANSTPSIVLKLVYPNLDKYWESGSDPYHTIELSSLPRGSQATVNDVVEAYQYDQEIAFCGSINNEAYIGVVDRKLQAIPRKNIQVYNFLELYSIVEVPGKGYIACGENSNNKGVIMLVKYDLQMVVNYEYPVPLTQVIYDKRNQRIIFCGINRLNSELSVYNVSWADLLSGVSAQGFVYYPGRFSSSILLATDNIRNVRMTMLNNEYVAISASGRIPQPSNTAYNGLLHVNRLDGQNPLTNVLFNWNSDKIFFRDIQASTIRDQLNPFNEKIYLLFHHNGSLSGEVANPVLVEADVYSTTNWSGVKISSNQTGNMKDYTRMFILPECRRLCIGGYENDNSISSRVNSRNHYANIKIAPLNIGWNFEISINSRSFIINSPRPIINPAPGFTKMNIFWQIRTYPVTPAAPPVVNPPMALIYNNAIPEPYCRPIPPTLSTRSQEIEEANTVVESSAEIRFYEDRAEFSDISGYTQYAVYDMMGRKILDSKLSDNTISFSSMSKGMYILRLLKADGDSEQHKFIVK